MALHDPIKRADPMAATATMPCTDCKGARGWLTDNGPAPTGWEDCPECGGDGLDHSAEARNPWAENRVLNERAWKGEAA